MCAWTLVQTMNRCFHEPLGETVRGGATLTPTGRRVLALDEELEREAEAATVQTQRKFLALLKKGAT